MTIGIDARFFGPKGKGLGRYTQKLIENLEKIDRKNQYVVFLRRENWEEYRPNSPNFKKILANYRWYSLAEQVFLPFKIYGQKIDLMHFPHFNVPVFYFGKFVVTIHDLILQHFPTRRSSTLGFFKYWLKNFAYKIVIKTATRRAKKIIVPSNWVKKDILSVFNVSADKIRVTYEGAPDQNQKSKIKDQRNILDEYKINRPYLLYVGNAYPHKNLERLIEGFGILCEKYGRDFQLVLIGEEDYFYNRLKSEIFLILRSGREISGVVFAGFVPDEELEILYKNASLYVFPSLCEGFGLPPLEAMSYGLSTVCSGATCLPEVLGEAALYFDATNPQDMAEKIDQVLRDNNLRDSLIKAGHEQIKKYSWQKMAEETLDIYRSATG